MLKCLDISVAETEWKGFGLLRQRWRMGVDHRGGLRKSNSDFFKKQNIDEIVLVFIKSGSKTTWR